MSNRERWVVYPLLFLSIGLGLRNGVDLQETRQEAPAAALDLLRCKTLEIVGADGRPRVTVGTTRQGNPSLEMVDANEKPLAQIGPSAAGAELSLFDQTGQSVIRLGYENQLPMLLVMDPTNRQIQSLFTVPLLPLQLGKLKAGNSTAPQKHDGAKPDEETNPPTN